MLESDISRIKLLDNRLANQIAAGEVVERPSSVVKELVENSIDAGASRIEVDIERGGTRLIRITDDGKGIHKSDLELALTRHATSKIHSAEDLVNIRSLGFRGEALASIGAVSRLTLTSKAKDSELAWQAVAHGRDMSVEVSPAAAIQGTRIEVADLFFNTPARQKFLRTEKTEFNHIEEIFKRHALANFQIAFLLKHNHKVVKRVPASGEKSQFLKRVATICGKPFADHAVAFECQHEIVRLWGWLGKPDFHRSESDIQYVFVNGRPVKDKTLNHAIRQAYDGLLPPGRMATFVIYLELDPCQVDVNVHPTKHEVRFSQQRLVHDLLAKSVKETLESCEVNQLFEHSIDEGSEFSRVSYREISEQQNIRPEIKEAAARLSASEKTVDNDLATLSLVGASDRAESEVREYPSTNSAAGHVSNSYRRPVKQVYSSSLISQVAQQFVSEQETQENGDQLLFKVDNNYWIQLVEKRVYVIDITLLCRDYILKLLDGEVTANSRALLFPQVLSLDSSVLEDCSVHQAFRRLGFDYSSVSSSQIEIKKVPEWMQELENSVIFSGLPEWLIVIQKQLSGVKFAADISALFVTFSDSLVGFLCKEMKSYLMGSGACKIIESQFLAKLFDEN